MNDKFVYECPQCGVVEERAEKHGAVCTECHVFMKRVIQAAAFEEPDVEQEA